MSADDGVYVIKLRSTNHKNEFVYRVARLQAIETVLESPENIFYAFADSPVIHNYNIAIGMANYIDLKDYQSEYGVMIINKYKEKTWSELVTSNQYLN